MGFIVPLYQGNDYQVTNARHPSMTEFLNQVSFDLCWLIIFLAYPGFFALHHYYNWSLLRYDWRQRMLHQPIS